MDSEAEGSVTRWISELKQGDPEAVQRLWERYYDRLVRLARNKLASARLVGAEADAEDAALSGFDSFYHRAVAGRFPRLADRDDLWRLLVVITSRKALDQIDQRKRQKRGGNRVLDEAALADEGFERIIGAGPTPEFAAMVVEEYHRLLDGLGDETLQRIAIWKMEGFTNEEIRQRLGCALRTVANKLELIRRTWATERVG